MLLPHVLGSGHFLSPIRLSNPEHNNRRQRHKFQSRNLTLTDKKRGSEDEGHDIVSPTESERLGSFPEKIG